MTNLCVKKSVESIRMALASYEKELAIIQEGRKIKKLKMGLI